MKRWKKIIVWILRILSRMKTEHPLNAPVPAQCVVGKSPLSTERAGGESSGLKFSAQLQRSQVLSSLRSDCRASDRKIDLIVLHCSATWPSIDYTLQRLTRDHRARGFGTYPGYHIYVRRDGTVHYCRPVSIAGCHVSNYNRHSIGVCYEGGCSDSVGHKPEDNRTAEQLVALHEVLTLLLEVYPDARLVGHNDLNPHKACPCFDVRHEYAYLTRIHGMRVRNIKY